LYNIESAKKILEIRSCDLQYKQFNTRTRRPILIDAVKLRKILYSLFFFFIAGLCEIGGGYLVWLWLREDMSWVLGAIGGFVLFLYGIVPTLQPSYFHRIYAAYGGVFIAMALVWGLLFEKVIPDFYDILGAVIAIIGVVIIFYVPRKGEEALWQR
jgi:small multidrug resistance family-3 protein